MYKIVWVSIGHGYRSEQNQTYATRAEADAECARLNNMWAGTITHWVVDASGLYSPVMRAGIHLVLEDQVPRS